MTARGPATYSSLLAEELLEELVELSLVELSLEEDLLSPSFDLELPEARLLPEGER